MVGLQLPGQRGGRGCCGGGAQEYKRLLTFFGSSVEKVEPLKALGRRKGHELTYVTSVVARTTTVNTVHTWEQGSSFRVW